MNQFFPYWLMNYENRNLEVFLPRQIQQQCIVKEEQRSAPNDKSKEIDIPNEPKSSSKPKKSDKKSKKIKNDELYMPQQDDDLKGKGSLPIFREGRNSHSNVLRYFFKSLESQEMNLPFQRARQMKNCSSLSKKIFLQWIKDNGLSYKNYMRTSTLIKLLQKNKECGKILFILFKFYLQNYGRLHLMTSRKLKKLNLFYCLKSIRQIQEIFYDKLSPL